MIEEFGNGVDFWDGEKGEGLGKSNRVDWEEISEEQKEEDEVGGKML